MTAFELCHHLKGKRCGKKGFAALKIDMSNAYDRIEWPFLLEMMLKLGFHAVGSIWLWSALINVLHNGKELGPIHPRKGLQKGNPLSPNLFIICVEGLSSSLSDLQGRGLIHGCKISRGNSANETRQLASYSDLTQSKFVSSELDSKC